MENGEKGTTKRFFGKTWEEMGAGSESDAGDGDGISAGGEDVHVPTIVTARSADLEKLVRMYESFLREILFMNLT